MNKLNTFTAFVVCPVFCIGQASLKIDSNPILSVDLGFGIIQSYAGVSLPLGKNQIFLDLRYLQNVSNSDSSANQWYGLENSISLNKKTELIVGLGYLTNLEESVAFDISPKIGVQTKLAGNLYGGMSYFQFVPRQIRTSYTPLITLDLKYIVLNKKSSRGLVKGKHQNNEIYAVAAFGGYYSSLGLDVYSPDRDRLGLTFRVYTKLGTLFETENYSEWQLLSVNYRYSITKEIEIAGLLGVASELELTRAMFSPLIGLNLRTLIYEHIYFTVEASQTSKTLVRDRIRPIVHSGLSVLL